MAAGYEQIFPLRSWRPRRRTISDDEGSVLLALAASLTNSDERNLQEPRKPIQLSRLTPDPDRAMVRRPLSVPCFDKTPGADGEAIVAVGITNAQHFSGHAISLGRHQFEPMHAVFHYRQQSDRSMLDAHLHGESASHFPVIHGERPYLRFALGDGYVARPVGAH